MYARARKARFPVAECSLSFAKTMLTSGKKTCFQFPECSLSFAKIRKKLVLWRLNGKKRRSNGMDRAFQTFQIESLAYVFFGFRPQSHLFPIITI